MERKVNAWAAMDSSGRLSPYSFHLRETGPDYILLRVLYCGVDHTDLHQIKGELTSSTTKYPLVPGFAVKIPLKLAPEQATPLLCAGVTAYSPLKQFMGSEMVFKGGILGLGGVGHLGVMIAKAMGHHVTVISSSDKKKEEALQHLHADHFLLSTSEAEMKKAANSLDYILDTVPAFHPLESYLSLLKPEGKLLIVGAVPQRLQFFASELITGKKAIMGSLLGSIKETEELLNFWVEKGLTTMIEVVKMEYVNEAFERMEKNDVRYRFVLDVAGSNPE